MTNKVADSEHSPDAKTTAAMESLAHLRKVPPELVLSLLSRALEYTHKEIIPPESAPLMSVRQLLKALTNGTVAQYARFLDVDPKCVRAALFAAGSAPEADDVISSRIRRDLWRYLHEGKKSKRLTRVQTSDPDGADEEDPAGDEAWDHSGDQDYNPPWEHEQYWEK